MLLTHLLLRIITACITTPSMMGESKPIIGRVERGSRTYIVDMSEFSIKPTSRLFIMQNSVKDNSI